VCSNRAEITCNRFLSTLFFHNEQTLRPSNSSFRFGRTITALSTERKWFRAKSKAKVFFSALFFMFFLAKVFFGSKFFSFFVLPFLSLFLSLSVFFLQVFREISVSFIFFLKNFFFKKNQKKSILLIFLVSLIFSLPLKHRGGSKGRGVSVPSESLWIFASEETEVRSDTTCDRDLFLCCHCSHQIRCERWRERKRETEISISSERE